MARGKVERRLTAILAADVAGYSSLVAADEEGTLARFAGHVSELIAPQIEARHGRIFKTMGDGLLAAFPSVVEALHGAIEIQRGMAQRNAQTSQAEQISFRIAVHSADVVIEEDDIFGDGVNVAARMEALADPGGICVSARVQEDAHGRIDVGFEDLGEQRLKNIPRPVRVYRVRLEGEVEGVPRRPLPLPDKPSIAVLAFNNMSGDPEQEYFADALTEDIITALSRWRWFFVIARNSTFTYKGRAVDVKQVGEDLGVRYVLEGSVRKAGNRVRVTAQLIEAANASHIWADSFDRELTDFLVLQDELTERVVAAIEPAMLHSEGARTTRKNVSDLTALDCFQRGMWHLNTVSREGYHEAVALFREAIRRDPQLSLGYIGLARILYGGAAGYSWSSRPEQDLQEARIAARTAISLDPGDAYGWFALAGASLYLGLHDEALDAARRAVALNPNFGLGYSRLGQVLIYCGRPAEAVAPIRNALRLSPFDNQLGANLGALALAYYQARDYAEAAVQARLAVQQKYSAGYPLLAASLARLGRLEEARGAMPAQLLRRAARDTPRLAAYANDADRDHFLEGLVLAGIGAGQPTPAD